MVCSYMARASLVGSFLFAFSSAYSINLLIVWSSGCLKERFTRFVESLGPESESQCISKSIGSLDL